jgi:hypothetical protein
MSRTRWIPRVRGGLNEGGHIRLGVVEGHHGLLLVEAHLGVGDAIDFGQRPS